MIRAIRSGAWASCLILSVILSSASDAHACAVCGCGDPTLTAMGAEQPFAGRFRASLIGQYRTDRIGEEGVDRIELSEFRLDANVAWAPHERVFLMLTVPMLWRHIEYVNEAERNTWGLGDVEVRGKIFVLQDRPFAPRHLLSVIVGIKLPTAPLQREDGELLPIEVQPGTGSFDPLAGISYAYFAFPWSAYASVQGTYPTKGTEGFRASRSLRTTIAAQYQLLEALAFRGGIDTRLDDRALEDGMPSRDSAGFIAFASPEVLFSITEDLVLSAYARIPVLTVLKGFHKEGPFFGLGAAYDF